MPITFESSFKTSNLSLFAHLTWFELSELASSEWPPLSANWIAAPISLQEISTGFVIARKYVDLPWKSAEISKTSKRPWPSAGSPNYYETDASPTRKKDQGFSKGPSFQIDREFILLCRSVGISDYSPKVFYSSGSNVKLYCRRLTSENFPIHTRQVSSSASWWAKLDAILGKLKPNMVIMKGFHCWLSKGAIRGKVKYFLPPQTTAAGKRRVFPKRLRHN